jgi:hypothetical protein
MLHQLQLLLLLLLGCRLCLLQLAVEPLHLLPEGISLLPHLLLYDSLLLHLLLQLLLQVVNLLLHLLLHCLLALPLLLLWSSSLLKLLSWRNWTVVTLVAQPRWQRGSRCSPKCCRRD